jgi:hypothetical protein
MKQLWRGFKDVWNVLIIDSFRGVSGPWINLFDIGVFLGALSMLALLIGAIIAVKTVVFWIF